MGVDVEAAIVVAVISMVAVGWGVSDGTAEAVKVGKGVLVGTEVMVGARVAPAAGVAGGATVQVGGTVAGTAVAVSGGLMIFSGEDVGGGSVAASVGKGLLSPPEPKPWQPAANKIHIRNNPACHFMLRPRVGHLAVPGLRSHAWSLPDRGIRW